MDRVRHSICVIDSIQNRHAVVMHPPDNYGTSVCLSEIYPFSIKKKHSGESRGHKITPEIYHVTNAVRNRGLKARDVNPP